MSNDFLGVKITERGNRFMPRLSYNIDPVHEFSHELSQIKNDVIYELTVKALYNAPAYFWFVPASSSGKYHPKLSLGISGLVRHTKAAVRIALELFNNPMLCPFPSDLEKDMIISALILHDTCKQGIKDDGEHTVYDHPILVRGKLKPTDMAGEIDELWDAICDIIETHMGPWNKNREGVEILDVPDTELQKFAHLCDFLASRACIEVDVTDRVNQNSTTSDKWKQEPASDGQIGFIKKLVAIMKSRGLSSPDIPKELTKGIAANKINEMKSALNMT